MACYHVVMPRKPSPKRIASTKTRKTKAADPAQYERFREFARAHEASDDPADFDEAARKIIPRRPNSASR
jgi:hypothetical protein